MKRTELRFVLSVRILADNRPICTTLELIPETALPVGELSPWISKKVRAFASEIYGGEPTSWEILHVREGTRNLLRTDFCPGSGTAPAVPSNIGLTPGAGDGSGAPSVGPE